MKADVGDHLVTEGPAGRRECEIIKLEHADGSPPYVVRWLGSGHIALIVPGPYTRLIRLTGGTCEQRAQRHEDR
jgi:hypothetical protein